MLLEEKALESNLSALQLNCKELELSDLQQFVSDIESAADAAEIDEVYSLHKFSLAQQTSKRVLTSKEASLQSSSSILEKPAKEYSDPLKIEDKHSIFCKKIKHHPPNAKKNLLVRAPLLNLTAFTICDKP